MSEVVRSLREYGRGMVRGFHAVVAGLVLELLGLLGIFSSNERAIHIVGVAGVMLGFALAPFLAFHRLRVERDAALAPQAPFRVRFTNALSGGNWAIDSFASTMDEGVAARAIVAAVHEVALTTDLTSAHAEGVVRALRTSAAERFLTQLGGENGHWELVTPTNEWVITAKRETVSLGDGFEMYARAIVQLPRSYGGRWPVAVLDVFLRPERVAVVPDAQFNTALSPVPQGRARLGLDGLRELLRALSTTVVDELAPAVFPAVVEWRPRRRLSRRPSEALHLAGPNLDVRSRPHQLGAALELPAFPRRANAPDTDRIMIETPDTVDAADAAQRDRVIVSGLVRFLRQLEFVEPEAYEHELHAPRAVALQ